MNIPLIGEEIFFYPLILALAVFAAYKSSDIVISWLHEKTLGSRAYVLEKLEKMFVETSAKKVTWTMIAISFGPGFLVFFILLPNVIAGFIFGAIVTALGWQVPKLLVDNLYEKRCARFNDQMVDALTLLTNGVKSGLTVTQSMERVVENMGNPISQEFSLVLKQTQFGLSVEDALNEMGERVPLPDVQMFVTSVNILKETGGDMSETFGTISETIRDRQKVQKKIEALTAQGTMQGIIISLVPFGIFLVFWMIDPDYIRPMFTTTFGIIMLFIVLVLQVIGGLAIKKIVKIKV